MSTTKHEGAIIRPNTGNANINSIGAVGEQSRSMAEIQSALTIAAARPRDEKHCIAKIKNACQRKGLAESAEYCYSRGGTEIIGPTIDLLEVIAGCWGNLQFGFRELAQRRGESEVESFAWDLESNTKRVVVFTVPHRRHTKEGSYELADPRDIYELVANNAQRRTRACLEAIIPPDVVEDAVNECRLTLKANAAVTPESLQALLEAFAPLGVDRQQIEARLQRSLDAMQPAQLVSMRRIYKSIKDGMSTLEQWFTPKPVPDESANGGDTATADLKAQLKASVDKAKAEQESKSSKAENSTAAQQGGPGDDPAEKVVSEGQEAAKEPGEQPETVQPAQVDPKEGESPADYWIRALRAQPTLETLNTAWAQAEADQILDTADTSAVKSQYEKLAKSFAPKKNGKH